jgi:hypothetical protein
MCLIYVGLVSVNLLINMQATQLMESNISSTHNTRIERLWVEVGTQFAQRWRGFFSQLE